MSEEEGERGFSGRVRKMGSEGNWGVTEAGESIELQYKWKRGGRRVFLGSPPLQEIWASPRKKQKQMGFKMDRLLYRPSRLPMFCTLEGLVLEAARDTLQLIAHSKEKRDASSLWLLIGNLFQLGIHQIRGCGTGCRHSHWSRSAAK